MKVPTFIINLKIRPERKENILKEFQNKEGFNVIIIEAIQNEIGALGLWQTIQHILRDLADDKDDYILICEDDHQFTADYSKEILSTCIAQAKENNADVLCGGISWFNTAIQASENLFWTNSFTGNQFIILFKKFWNTILKESFNEYDVSDIKISNLSKNIFFIHPFVSIQKDYGYSDVTAKNNSTMVVSELFKCSVVAVDIVKNMTEYYKQINISYEGNYDLEKLSIPTYIINYPQREDRRKHIEKQFAAKKEFDITIIDAVKHEVKAVGLWLSIRKILAKAVENDDDVIIICEDDHEFTNNYSREYLLQNVIEAAEQGCSYLSCGTSNFRCAIPVSKNRYWVSSCLTTRFIVLYKNIFNKILEEPFDNSVITDLLLCEIISNKMILYPFISVQKDFDYSNITMAHNENTFLATEIFENCNNAIEKIIAAQQRFQ